MRLNAREHRARAAPTTSTLATIDHRATSLGPRCAIATSTATIRAPVDHPTIEEFLAQMPTNTKIVLTMAVVSLATTLTVLRCATHNAQIAAPPGGLLWWPRRQKAA